MERETWEDCWSDVADVLAAGIDRLILYGPPGTGKTYAALHLGVVEGPAERLVCTEDLTSAEVTGTWMPTGEATWSWLDGPALRAWSMGGVGGRLVIDEVDRASGDALSALLAATDSRESAAWRDPRSGEWRYPGPGFSAVMTTNLEDLSLLPASLRDRFPVAVRIDRPPVAAVATLSEDLRGPALAGSVGEHGRRVSLRRFAAFDRLRRHHGARRAADLVFGADADDLLDALRLGALA